MKKLRSNIPRRKRSTFSPIFLPPSVPLKHVISTSSSNITRDITYSSSVSINNVISLKKRCFSDLSEASSCVELCDSNSNNNNNNNTNIIIRKGVVSVLNEAEVSGENDVVSELVTATRSECSVVQQQQVITNGEHDVVSVNEGQSVNLQTKQAVEDDDDDEAENCGESKLISTDIDLTCSEQFSYEDEDSGYSSAGCTDVNNNNNNNNSNNNNMESSEFEISSDFLASSWYDSGSQFSERSVGDPVPSPTFQLFLIYRQKFCKSEFSSKICSGHDYNEPSNGIIKLLRPEDEEHEESYQMMKERERRQVYLHDYAEEYCEMTEYGDLVVQQRLQMVHWIMEQSANKDLQKETMFLSVSLLDRFLSKGYFRSKVELEIAGIACLTLATRIEENQPYNTIQQKLFNVGSNEYSRSEVVAMEWLVQDVLSFRCYLPTIYNFLWFYLKAARSNEDVVKTAKYLAVLALLGHEQLCYWPSTVAASLVSLACLAGNGQSSLQQIAWIHNGSNDKDLPDCIKSLEWLVQYI